MTPRFNSLNYYLLLGLDLALVLAAHWLAYLTRFEGIIPALYLEHMLHLLPWLALTKLACFHFFGLYSGMWRYTSIPDLINVLKAATVSSLVILAYLIFRQHFVGHSRSVFILDWLYTIFFISGTRLGIRMLYGARMISLPSLLVRRSQKTGHFTRCVLLGAGDGAERLLRELQATPHGSIKVVAAFDDDPGKQGRQLRGVPIIGALEDLPTWVQTYGDQVDQALIAIPSLRGPGLRRIIELCEFAGVPYKTLPSLENIASGLVSIKELRDVDYKDLLGREPARLEVERIAGYVEGRIVLVTGAGGSIGSELCRQLLPFRPGRLLLLDQSEANLYAIQMELLHERKFPAHTVLLGSLTDSPWIAEVLDRHKPEVVFHAAAYKHVPMLELQPWQAVWNNVQATKNLISLAVEKKVERLLLVSTDKAVRPTNVMGVSKRLTELLMQAYVDKGTRLMAVRFGNVVGSAGSVIPLFRRQIERGGPVTVTHPEVVRYFMTVEEACQLILQAGSMGGKGEIFVLKMGQPVKITDMARDLIRLSGKEPDRDVEIRYIGLRPGEKLYEELITQGEDVSSTEHEQILVLTGERTSLEALENPLRKLAEAAQSQDRQMILAAFKEMVPEFQPYSLPENN